MATPPRKAKVLQRAVDEVERHGSVMGAAKAIGIPVPTLRSQHIEAKRQGFRPAPGIQRMPAPERSNAVARDELQRDVDAVAAYGGNVNAASRALGIGRPTLQHRLQRANRLGLVPSATVASPAGADLRDRVRELEAALNGATRSRLDEDYVKRKIIGLAESLADVEPPSWALRPVRDSKLPGVPNALWTDWHCGEVVDAAQVNGVNAFDLTIFDRRVRLLVDKVIYLLQKHVVNPQYPGIVVNLGGDMLSGDIHDELTATNEKETLAAMLDLQSVLLWALRSLADAFGNVFVVCVPGNHGRLTRKPRAKGRAFTNLDWLSYQFLARALESDARVRFFIPDGPDALYRVYGHRYLLNHGDQFRGGDGMIGHFGPVLRGHKKKLARNANIGLEYDTMLHGHFHTYFPTQSIIGNGSLVGYNEYAMENNFPYEPPIQALWLTHPEHGVTLHMPVYLEPHYGRERAVDAQDWITWRDERV